MRRWRDLRRWSVYGIFIALLAMYLANGRVLHALSDTLPARFLPFTVLQHGTFRLDHTPVADSRTYHHAIRHTERGVLSDFPVMAAVMALPVYVPVVLAGGVDLNGPWPARLEKLSGAVIVAASAAGLYLVARLLVSDAAALVITMVYGLGTTAFSTNSSGLWQHGPAALALTAAAYCLVRGRTEPQWLARSALPLAMAVLARPPVMTVVLPVAIYALMQRPGLPRFVAWGLPAVVFHVWYGLAYFGVLNRVQYPPFDPGIYTTPLGEGLYGLLIGPGRGLFVYSPVFLLSMVGAVLVWRRGGAGLLRALSVGIIPTVILYARSIFWTGGLTYGPRYLGDLNVSLTLLLVPVLPIVRRSRAALAGAALLVAASIISHAYGAFAGLPFRDAASHIEELWLWSRHPLVAALSPPGVTGGMPEPFFRMPQPVVGQDARVAVRLSTDRIAHDAPLEIGLSAENLAARPLDLYAGFLVSRIPPFGVVAFIPSRQRMATPVDARHRDWFRRLAVIAPGQRLQERELLRAVMHHSVSPGSVSVFAALVEPGSAPWRLAAADVRSVEIVEALSRDEANAK